jgi:hypothetical protein
MSPFTAQDVLSDIEFEIAQGAVSRDDLGQGIQAVRQFQAKTRAEIFDAQTGALDQRQIISRQFQILEMQTTLLQETAAAIRSLQLDLRRVSQTLAQRTSRLTPTAASSAVSEIAAGTQAEALANWSIDDAFPLEFTPEKTEQVEQAMQPAALQVKIEARPVKIPLIGGFLQRLRTGLHSLAWFYAQQVGRQQAPINRLYGEQLLQLMQLANAQQRQLAQLDAQIVRLQARPTGRDGIDTGP